MINICFFCEEDCDENGGFDLYPEKGGYIGECQICGRYGINQKVVNKLESLKGKPQYRANCSHHNIKVNKEGQFFPFWFFKESDLDSFNEMVKSNPSWIDGDPLGVLFNPIANQYVDHSVKSKKLLSIVSNKVAKLEAFSSFSIEKRDFLEAKISTKEELDLIISYLEEKKYIEREWKVSLKAGLQSHYPTFETMSFFCNSPVKKYISQHPPVDIFGAPRDIPKANDLLVHKTGQYRMTISGWEMVRKINKPQNSKQVFIAMQFEWGENDNLRKEVLNAIKEACSSCGYESDIVSQNHTENITDKIISEIQSARFVVAEMTYNNRGVYYESGYARGRGIPVFHLIKDDHIKGRGDKKIHFDIQQIMYKSWKNPCELKEKLTDWINTTVGKIF